MSVNNHLEKIHLLRREYTHAGLHRRNLPKDPRILFEQWLQQACEAELTDPTAMSLSTVDVNGQPHQRIVLLKAYDESGMHFYTNLESHKARHLEHNPHVSALFPWLHFERQVRVLGIAEKLPEVVVEKYFRSRPRASQIAAWASPQSDTIATRDFLEHQFSEWEQKFAHVNVPVPKFWGGFIIKVKAVEFWQGREHRLHDRFLYEYHEKQWKISRLAP